MFVISSLTSIKFLIHRLYLIRNLKVSLSGVSSLSVHPFDFCLLCHELHTLLLLLFMSRSINNTSLMFLGRSYSPMFWNIFSLVFFCFNFFASNATRLNVCQLMGIWISLHDIQCLLETSYNLARRQVNESSV